MDRDDEQQFKHGIRTLVECTNLIREEIQRYPFPEETAEKMVLTYWHALITSSFTPDFGSMIKEMFKTQ